MSTDLTEIEKRLASVEASIRIVQQKLGLLPSETNWVEQISGSLKDIPEEDYQLFLKECEAVRNGGGIAKV
ncbi:hypothetical protein BH10PLA2_BH10PLA2_13140 [soil metagenome]